MTLPNSWVLYYMHDKEELYNLERLQLFFTHLAECNCYVAPESEVASLAIWRKYLVNAPQPQDSGNKRMRRTSFSEVLKPGVSEALREQAQVYVAERQQQLTLEARSMASSHLVRGFEFTVTIAPEEGYILLAIEQERFFRSTLEGITRYRYWVKCLEKVYACWQPLYAHEFTHQGPPSINPSWEEVQALKIPALYALNIYGPELIEQLGKERLLDAPAWVVRELDKGGCLLIPADPHNFSRSSPYTFNGVAQHLGFPVEASLEEV